MTLTVEPYTELLEPPKRNEAASHGRHFGLKTQNTATAMAIKKITLSVAETDIATTLPSLLLLSLLGVVWLMCLTIVVSHSNK